MKIITLRPIWSTTTPYYGLCIESNAPKKVHHYITTFELDLQHQNICKQNAKRKGVPIILFLSNLLMLAL